MQLTKERLIFLLRIKEGDKVLCIESGVAEEVIVELKDVLNNRIWLSNKKSVRCNDGCYHYENIVNYGRIYRYIEESSQPDKTMNYNHTEEEDYLSDLRAERDYYRRRDAALRRAPDCCDPKHEGCEKCVEKNQITE